MDRYRLNQILEVLLFPVCDPDMAKRDPLLKKYEVYRKFMEAGGGREATGRDGKNLNGEFKKAEKELLEHLRFRNHGRVNSYDDLLLLSELYYPMKKIYRIDCGMNGARDTGCRGRKPKEIMASYYIKNLARISRSLLTYRDGVASVKTWMVEKSEEEDIFSFSTVFNKVEIWNLLCRMTVPDIYIAILAVESGKEIHTLYRQKSEISLMDKLLVQKVNMGMAENHLHLNAGYDYEMLWLRYMDLNIWLEMERGKLGEDEKRLLQAVVFRCMAAFYLNQKADCMSRDFEGWLKENCPDRALVLLGDLYEGKVDEKGLDAGNKAALKDIYEKMCGNRTMREYDFLLQSIYTALIELGTSSEMIFLYQAYGYIKEKELDTFFVYLFIQYLRVKNNFFQQVQEQHEVKGLIFFQKKYRNARSLMKKGMSRTDQLLEIFRSQNHITSLRKLEIRIAPSVSVDGPMDFVYEKCRNVFMDELYQQLYEVIYAYRQFILENIIGIGKTRELLEREERAVAVWDKTEQLRCRMYVREELEKKHTVVPTLGIVFHFLKSGNLNNSSGYFCWRSVCNERRMHPDYLLINRQIMRNVAMALQEVRSEIPYLSEYVVGIDAASDENAMEPWMFAPAYHTVHLKNGVKVVGGNNRVHNIQSMRFTYHVGEDFRHILSGLRHVDEVMEEFRYQTGDRLGHALAIGINPQKWIAENEVVPMPIREYLENLLWLWGLVSDGALEIPLRLTVLENKIMSIVEELYEHSEGLTVRTLYRAYKKKFENISLEDIRELIVQIEGEDTGEKLKKSETPTYCYYGKNGEKNCYTNWTVEKLFLTSFCPVFEERYSKVVLIPVLGEEAQLYQMLQEYLIEKVERLGIFVETNPTSNLTIGDFSQMKEHPIFRLNAIRNDGGHHVLVTINSDDPSVFNTNVENELAYIYYAAEYQGYSKEEVLTWIDRIRQNGMDGSFIVREKKTEEILDEVEEILEELRRKRE